LGRYGAWLPVQTWSPGLAAEIEELGYGAIWVGASPAGDLRVVESLLDATAAVTVATSVVNIWKDDAATAAASMHRIDARHPGRLLLGLGVGHPERTPRYASPYEALTRYLDELDVAAVPANRRALAALGPGNLRLAAARSLGALPYLTTPAHTALARAELGAGALLAPEHMVVVSTDEVQARALGRERVGPYLGLTNYRRSLGRLGYSEADLADGGSDRLIDDLAVHGSAIHVAHRLEAHHEAGADHVAIQVLGGGDPGDVSAIYRDLAGSLSQ
jgi:probable F420-dependent oxidoreductase